MSAVPTKPDEAFAALAAAGSAGLLAAAFLFQHVAGLPPCVLCIWQRWPHAVALGLGLLMLAPPLRRLRALRVVGLLSMLTAAGLGLQHTGVERGWWEGPGECAGGQSDALSTDALMDSILSAPVVRCDEVAWSLLGLSMASWQGLAALALAGLWALSLRAQGSSSASQ
ncbi:MAG: disulfide bond formation protein B [Paracoccaceae bacterium]